MSEQEQKCIDANYTKHDIIDISKDKESTLKIGDLKFKVTILRMTRYMPPPLRAAKTCFTSHKPGHTFVEICIKT